ncbi:TPA: hypothetical protein N0F65_000794 [Lagenidium giganteum]|uniref:Uncharacterized protein n=1 Tax=Lagenidium giganteum TaxID=4803 RepID=A0AAV2ZGB7_9STRA|nr:TPA: hypothetical protein N0F65_000794 [Lagenidium giganteum]
MHQPRQCAAKRLKPKTCCEWLKSCSARNARPCGMKHSHPHSPLQATSANACFRRASSFSPRYVPQLRLRILKISCFCVPTRPCGTLPPLSAASSMTP